MRKRTLHVRDISLPTMTRCFIVFHYLVSSATVSHWKAYSTSVVNSKISFSRVAPEIGQMRKSSLPFRAIISFIVNTIPLQVGAQFAFHTGLLQHLAAMIPVQLNATYLHFPIRSLLIHHFPTHKKSLILQVLRYLDSLFLF